MTLNELLHAGDSIYSYSDDDKAILRELARTDPDGLRLALETDPLVKDYREIL
jgi:hypothetical protein